MKDFRHYVSEEYDYHRHPQVPPEKYDANDHAVRMVAVDTEYRRHNPKTPGYPLIHQLHTLYAINDLYLGMIHGDKYPEHAAKIDEYKATIHKYAPHIANDAIPDPKNKTWTSGL